MCIRFMMKIREWFYRKCILKTGFAGFMDSHVARLGHLSLTGALGFHGIRRVRMGCVMGMLFAPTRQDALATLDVVMGMLFNFEREAFNLIRQGRLVVPAIGI